MELYYKLINQAELEICKEDYKSALKLYQEAFRLNPEMTYTIDLGNAITVCAKPKQWKKAKGYFVQLKGKGLSSPITMPLILAEERDVYPIIKSIFCRLIDIFKLSFCR